jgi:pimeloyl-ACP methyl ester carboxylesterase
VENFFFNVPGSEPPWIDAPTLLLWGDSDAVAPRPDEDALKVVPQRAGRE